MTEKNKLYSKIIFNLSRIYHYAKDLQDVFHVETNSNINIDKSKKHGINMCLVQMGEHSKRIRDIQKENDISIIDNNALPVDRIKGLRDRIVHTYDDIDYKIIEDVIKNDIPIVINYIERIVDKELLDNPYCLLDEDYDLADNYFNTDIDSIFVNALSSTDKASELNTKK